MRSYPLLLLLLICSSNAFGDQVPPSFNRVSLQAEASAEVDNDQLVAVLYIQKEGNDSASLARDINRTMQWAMDLAGKMKDVQAQTLGYRTAPVYRKNVASGWRVSQSMRLESADHQALSHLIGQLQTRLALQSVSYEISKQKRRQAEEQLISEALARFQDRARLVTRQLGRKDYRLVQLDVNSGGQLPSPIPRTRMLAAEPASTPRLEAGTSEVRVQVSGTVELSED